MNVRKELVQGLRDGFPIGLGYAPVAFTFGFIAVSGGLPLWAAALISLTNLTSAGQFAGTNLILQGAGYIEVAMTTFVINIRYMLMSLSLGQRLEKGTGILSRMGFGFGITDETFVMASLSRGPPGALSVWTDPIPDPGLESGHGPGRKHFLQCCRKPSRMPWGSLYTVCLLR